MTLTYSNDPIFRAMQDTAMNLEKGLWDEALESVDLLIQDTEAEYFDHMSKLATAVVSYIANPTIGRKRHVGKLRNGISKHQAHRTLNPPQPETAKVQVPVEIEDSRKARLPKQGKKPLNKCLCGCDSDVKGQFKQGHDQRVKGMVRRSIDIDGNMFMDKLPETINKDKAVELAGRWGYKFKAIR